MADLVERDAAGLPTLRQEEFRPHDRPGDHAGEERDEEREVEQGTGRRHLAAVNVDGVGERLEGVEGDPDGQEQVGDRQAERQTQPGAGGVEVGGEKSRILESGEQTEVGGEAQAEPEALAGGRGGTKDAVGNRPIHHGRNPEDEQVRRVPGGVEKVTQEQQREFPGPPGQRGEARRQHDGKEEQKAQGIEEHLGGASSREECAGFKPQKFPGRWKFLKGNEGTRKERNCWSACFGGFSTVAERKPCVTDASEPTFGRQLST